MSRSARRLEDEDARLREVDDVPYRGLEPYLILAGLVALGALVYLVYLVLEVVAP